MVILEQQEWLKEIPGLPGMYFTWQFWWTYPKLFDEPTNPAIGFGGLARGCYVFVIGPPR